MAIILWNGLINHLIAPWNFTNMPFSDIVRNEVSKNLQHLTWPSIKCSLFEWKWTFLRGKYSSRLPAFNLPITTSLNVIKGNYSKNFLRQALVPFPSHLIHYFSSKILDSLPKPSYAPDCVFTSYLLTVSQNIVPEHPWDFFNVIMKMLFHSL